ncbi:alpha/beta fold hydrolase [Providencia vermicola]|uniref:Alpha/beta fold hydrolase n=2 Tax=Providencia TaxID=586 RepID=A0ABD5L6N9_PROST|nr:MULTISPECIES: alpha/beta fold hydrolase [Providencia]ELR5044233.1 alpha/beta fold hydrolase [Providencia rettgeri]ELR5120612.1 alpha/beta fold hydrolase [Providencia stuartii]ELR5291794.1 alpha/beta fold hydrolase [Providencia stuartii]ELX8381049.1 alpha/beta fold hydrolase [Providencia stuartii]EMD5260554.1 alpha/beta fold hydrolase [Providencia stuartii]
MTTLLNHTIHKPEAPISSTPVVLIHGLFGDLHNLGVLGRDLQKYFETIQVDVRNHGDSFRADTMEYRQMAQDVITLLQSLGYNSAILIGHSMGGKISMAATEIAPDFVEKVIAIDMAPVAYQVRRHDTIIAALEAVLRNGAKNRQEATAIMREYLDEDSVIQFLLKSFRQGEWKFNLPAIKDDYESIIGWKTVPTWDKPVLLIPGGNSPYVQAEYREQIAAQFPNAKAWVVADAGHWVHAEKPDHVLRAIHRFLSLPEYE